MARLIIDLTNYVDRFGNRVPEGRYLMRVDWTEVKPTSKTSKTPGVPMITLGLSVAEGPHEGQSVVDRLVQSPEALFRTVAFLQGLGIKTPRQRLELDPDAWKGLTLVADLVDGAPYRDKVKSEVAGYLPKAEADAWRSSQRSGSAPAGDGLDEFLPAPEDTLPEDVAQAERAAVNALNGVPDSGDINLDDIAL